MCDNNTIKELLPAFREQSLDQMENLLVQSHLTSCEDCRVELSLLRMMAEEIVPDPGEAFWAALPGRVYHQVQSRKAEKHIFDLSRLVAWMTPPRRAWASALVGLVLIASWLIIKPAQKGVETPLLQGYEFIEEILPAEPVNVAELDRDELVSIETWAGAEIASIAHESEPVLGNGQDGEGYEDLSELNKREAERLIKMIDQRMTEG